MLQNIVSRFVNIYYAWFCILHISGIHLHRFLYYFTRYIEFTDVLIHELMCCVQQYFTRRYETNKLVEQLEKNVDVIDDVMQSRNRLYILLPKFTKFVE